MAYGIFGIISGRKKDKITGRSGSYLLAIQCLVLQRTQLRHNLNSGNFDFPLGFVVGLIGK
jgi:hypothetical protein